MRSQRTYDEYKGDELVLQIKNTYLQLKVNLVERGEPKWFHLASANPVNDGNWHQVDLIASRLVKEFCIFLFYSNLNLLLDSR